MDPRDAHYMSQAIRIARRGLGQVWPNPAVGAVAVDPSGEIIGRGWRRQVVCRMPKLLPLIMQDLVPKAARCT